MRQILSVGGWRGHPDDSDARVDGKDIPAKRVRRNGPGRFGTDPVQAQKLEHSLVVVKIVQVFETVFKADRQALDSACEIVQ